MGFVFHIAEVCLVDVSLQSKETKKLSNCVFLLADFEIKRGETEEALWDGGQDNEVTSTCGNYGSSTGGTPLQVMFITIHNEKVHVICKPKDLHLKQNNAICSLPLDVIYVTFL